MYIFVLTIHITAVQHAVSTEVYPPPFPNILFTRNSKQTRYPSPNPGPIPLILSPYTIYFLYQSPTLLETSIQSHTPQHTLKFANFSWQPTTELYETSLGKILTPSFSLFILLNSRTGTNYSTSLDLPFLRPNQDNHLKNLSLNHFLSLLSIPFIPLSFHTPK